jgi:queuine tRNA-ribosyltransferase
MALPAVRPRSVNQIPRRVVQKRIVVLGSAAMSGTKSAFEVIATDGGARLSKLTLAGGPVALPAFMPVGTAAAVKSLTPDEVRGAGFGLVLANTYHLMLRPGVDVVENAGGIASFMAWEGPVLTDSGGYQVFSLADRCKVTEDGASFRSHIDGAALTLTPETAYDVQRRLGTDVAMALDVCPPGRAGRDVVAAACERTTRWLDRTIRSRVEGGPLVFGIAQGGVMEDLRLSHLGQVASRPVDGVALGGLSVGEDIEKTWQVIAASGPAMPADRPRYLMGMGRPEDILHAVGCGIDMFDCVMPTRSARHGQVFSSQGRYSIKLSRLKQDAEPLDPQCDCPVCKTFERRYLRHLFVAGETLGARLLTLHNLSYYGSLMRGIRDAIPAGNLDSFARSVIEGYVRD